MSIKTAVTDLVDALNGAGIDAAADPQDLTPPGVWVQLESIDHNLLSGDVTVRLRLYLIAGDTGTLNALDTLSTLLRRVLRIVDPNTDQPTTGESVYLPDNPSTPLPALRINIDTLETLT